MSGSQDFNILFSPLDFRQVKENSFCQVSNILKNVCTCLQLE